MATLRSNTQFIIGEGLTRPIIANLPTLIDTRLLIQANSGGGKSYAVRRLLEQTHGKVQQLVIDCEGEYASLREKFDYVLAGKDGETPAEPRSAKLLAERLLELKTSAILDIYELKHDARIRFVKDFLDTLVNAPKHLWHPVLVVIDEAHVFCPQKDKDSESASAVKDLCTRGRKRGFCAVLATQRLSKLHKDAAAECNNKLIGRSSMDVDMKRAAEELGFASRDQMLALRKLKPGDFYAFGPAISQEVTTVRVGAVITRHPKAGSHRRFKPPPPTKHIRALLPKLADLPAEVDEHEQTMQELRRDLIDARRQLRGAAHRAPVAQSKEVIKRVEVQVIAERKIKRLERLRNKLFPMAQDLLKAIETLSSELTAIQVRQRHEAAIGRTISAPQYAKSVHGASLVTSKPIVLKEHVTAPPDRAIRIPKGQRKVLILVAQHDEGITREQVSVMAAFKRSTRDQYLQWLVANGLITQNGSDRFTATETGITMLGNDYEVLPLGAALLSYWMQRLPSGHATVLDVLVKRHPQSVTRQEIDDATGFKRSTRDQYLQQLLTRKLVLSEGIGLKASDLLFG